MGNCLVKELKGVVNNPDLPVFGTLVLNTHAVESGNYTQERARVTLACAVGQEIVINAFNGVKLFLDWVDRDDPTAYKETVTLTGSGEMSYFYCYLTNADGKIRISNIYNITVIDNSGGGSPWISVPIIDIDALEYMTNLRELNLGFGSTVGSINSLSKLTELTGINLWQPGITGNIVSLGNCTKLTSTIYLNDGNIEGALEDFCNAQVAAGRTSGTVTIKCSAYITYQGSTVGNRTDKLIRFGSSMITPTADETAQGWQVV